jgi:osmoprotectant transport system permease protein
MMVRTLRLIACLWFIMAVHALPVLATDKIVVGSKNFPESRLLAEMFARVIEEHTGIAVERRFNLAGTQVCFSALRSGAIDVYPEYTGTGLVTLLGRQPRGGATDTLNEVRREFTERWDLVWLPPLGFENAYELAVPREVAERHGLKTISDLVPIAPELTAGLGYEFIERDDGLRGLREVYGLAFAEVRAMQQALKYQAAAEREIDCLDVYTTDGRLLLADLVVLADDQDFFPPYSAAPLARADTLRRHPEMGNALATIANAFDETRMRELNFRVQEGGESIESVARDALEALGLPPASAAGEAETPGPSLPGYLWSHRTVLGRQSLRHLQLTVLALGLGILVAVPLGMALERRREWAEPVIRLVGVTQTIPSIAILAFMIPLLGIGFRPALTALWIYSLFPILRNTFTGLRDASPDAVAAGHALGMTGRQLLLWIRLPLAVPLILAGVRTSAVLIVGTATLAAFIGAGGLGEPIVAGLQLADSRMILSGAIPAALLAVAVDLALGLVERGLTPRGVR